MASHSRSPESGAGPTGMVRPWVGIVALSFVLLTLATLVVAPIINRQRIAGLREEIRASEPARTLLTQIQFNLAREMAALSAFNVNGDSSDVEAFAVARAEEQERFEELAPLAARLGDRVLEQYVETRELAAQWHARTLEADSLSAWSETPGPRRVRRERQIFQSVIASSVAMDSLILEHTDETRRRIATTEALGVRISVALGLLAFLAAVAVAYLYLRVRRYSAEAERRRQEAEEALAEVARANESRLRLLQGVTHDVKNPLGAAKGYAELLTLGVKAPLDPGQVPLVKGVERSVDSALEIISNLLDMARVDSGGMPIDRGPTDLVAEVRDIVEDHRSALESAGHEVVLEAPDRLEVYTDPNRVRQILDNLLSNARKYTPSPGTITVVVARRAEEAGVGPWATVAVRDTGPGIPLDLREAVFNEFTRFSEDPSTTGHGLGLSIARRIARLLGGDLEVANVPGPGATFVLSLPLRASADSDGPTLAGGATEASTS
ncbi:MAG TPA: ATP-binding protein [Longimicrobiales bacterium]|nr:ATP-binding protein [Longimicrobiales bacterium]